MPAIDRTAYPCFSPITTASELQQSFTPTDTEREFAQASTRTNHHAFCFLVLLKCFQRLHYFPPLKEIPSVIVDHLRSCLQLRPDVPLAYENERTLYRHCATIREYLRITTFYGKQARHIAVQAVAPTQTKENTTQLFMFIEKRSKLRVPLNCEISFQVLSNVNLRGVGRLVDISSKALSFRTETVLPLGTRLQISIPWPVRLGDCPLKLVALGRVMNKRGEVVVVVVVSIDLHEFRTRGNRRWQVQPLSCNKAVRASVKSICDIGILCLARGNGLLKSVGGKLVNR